MFQKLEVEKNLMVLKINNVIVLAFNHLKMNSNYNVTIQGRYKSMQTSIYWIQENAYKLLVTGIRPDL